MMKTIIYCFLLVSLVACEEGQVGKTCLEPPCGKTDPERFNIVLGMKNFYEISDIVLDVNGEKAPLVFGIKMDPDQYYGCWNQTDIRPTPSLLSTLTYRLNGVQKSAVIEGATVYSNAMVIEISENEVINFDYKDCDDTPND